MNTFYFVLLIFLVMSPQTFSNGECLNFFSTKSKIDKQELERLLTYPISGFGLSFQTQRILESNNIHLLVDLVRTTELELLQLSEPTFIQFGDTRVPFGKGATFKRNHLIEVKALLSEMGLRLGMTEVVPWSDQKRNSLIEAYQANKQLPPVLVRRIITQREEKILKMRFGIGEERPYTLREVAPFFNVTGETIRKNEARALRKLRRYIIVELKWEDTLPAVYGEQLREWVEKLTEMHNSVPILFPSS